MKNLLQGNPTATPIPSTGFIKGKWIRDDFSVTQAATPGTLAFASANTGVGYACVNVAPPNQTPLPDQVAPPPVRLFSTQNYGLTWNGITAPVSVQAWCASSALMAPDHSDPADVFFLANSVQSADYSTVLKGARPAPALHLFRSQNGGQNWNELTLPDPARLSLGINLDLNPAHLAFSAQGDTVLLATATPGVGGVVFASHDNGATWQKALGPGNNSAVFLTFATGPKNTLLALTGAGYGRPGASDAFTLWSTSDGASWSQIANIPAPATAKTVTTLYAGVILTTSPDGNTVALIEPGIVSLGNTYQTRIARSLDGGATWKELPPPAVKSDGQSLTPLGFATGALLGKNYDVTDDGKFWIMPDNSDDYTQDTYYQVAGIYYVDETRATELIHLSKSEPGSVYVAGTFFAVNKTPTGFVFWSNFEASGLGATASGIYHYTL